MESRTDQELLGEYIRTRSDNAFSEIVQRYLDLVYSTAVRVVRNERTAEDVSQTAFLALARGAAELKDRAVLAGWLHRTTHNLAANAVRTESRRRTREQEAANMKNLSSGGSEDVWVSVEPELDSALGELTEPEREAILLRYFQRKTAREMGELLSTSEEAAQKRLSRAIERLREILKERGVTVAGSALVLAISTHGVIAAPPALATTIAAAASGLAAGVFATSSAFGLKTVAMTTFQKTIVAALLVTSVGFGVHEASKVSALQQQIRTIQAQQSVVSAETTAQLQAFANSAGEADKEVARLRAENSRLQRAGAGYSVPLPANYHFPPNRVGGGLRSGAIGDVARLKEYLKQRPDISMPEIQYLSDQKWLDAAGAVSLMETDEQFQTAAANLNRVAKRDFAQRLSWALASYAREHGDQLPTGILELKDYLNKQVNPAEGLFTKPKQFEPPVDDDLLRRYEVVRSGAAAGLSPQEAIIKGTLGAEGASVLEIGLGGYKEHSAEGQQIASGTWTGGGGYDQGRKPGAVDPADEARARGARMMIETKMAYLTNVLAPEQVEAWRSKKLEELQKGEEAEALLRSFGQ